MRETFLSFSPPMLGDQEVDEVVDTLRSDWITTGPKVKRFEEEFASYIGAPATLAVSSCTAALHVGLAAAGIGPGDSVISTPMTFCSSIHVIEQVGATPILVDVEPDTLNIDPSRIAEALEKNARSVGSGSGNGRVRALVPVHLYGHACDMDAILGIAREHGLAVIQDAAHALPSMYNGRLIGSESQGAGPSSAPILAAYSFYATKNMTTAEGGMLVGSREAIDEARVWSLHGMSHDAYKRYGAEGSWYYEVIRPGFKYNMTDIQAAIGLHQLGRLPWFQARRREVVRRYNEAFARLDALQIPVERPDVQSAWHLYVIRLNLEMLRIDRGRFIEELKLRNIGTSVHFIPIHLHPYYRDKYGYKPEDFPVAFREYRRIISLPLFPRMTDQDVDDVIEAVSDVARTFRR
ncbi:MAG: DegT/DnrJ/EryC1/StrS family aminotransferase [Chloroflexi bacterium]|nr:DegT/DnrJ/EryC1/StrS family aminotransferase [Chloroflexota bacterium]